MHGLPLSESDQPPTHCLSILPVSTLNSGGIAMTALRRRMIECLQLRGLSERTQDMYVRAVRQLAEHYRKSPDLITEEDLRQSFLYVKHVKQYSRRAST